jgi:hypothetical protein
MRISTFLLLLCLGSQLRAQTPAKRVYTITADSVKITNCDSSELIIENHTQNVPGFLFNTGRGRTIFQRGAQQIAPNAYLVGADTIYTAANSWLLGGNSPDTVGVFGTFTYQPVDFYVNGGFAARLSTRGNLLLGTTVDNGHGNLVSTGDILVNEETVGAGGGSNPSNSVLGYDALVNNVTGWGNVALGYLSSATCSSAYGNTAMGGYSLYENATGGSNVAVGYAAGFFCQGNGNVYIGNQAGGADTGNNKLFIANSDAGALLYGDFSSNQLQVNASTVPYTTFLSSSNFIVNGDTFLSDSLILNTVATGTNTDSILVISSGHAVHKVAQSSIGGAFNGILNSSLAVKDTVKAGHLILSPDRWADYVFDSSYKLPPLTVLEAYVRKEHHLPGIQSAAGIKKDGLDVGAGQAALLKKLEELTLYTIDQDKQLTSQRSEIDALKNEVEALKKLVLESTHR